MGELVQFIGDETGPLFLVLGFLLQVAVFVWFVIRVEVIYRRSVSTDAAAQEGLGLMRDLIEATRAGNQKPKS